MSQYTDKNFSLEDWRLIQDSIVDQISYLKSGFFSTTTSLPLDQELSRLEAMLEKVRPHTLIEKI